MQLLILRHGIAKDRARWIRDGHQDRRRPLTAAGIKKMRRAAKGIHKMLPKVDLIASSPLVRAMQTAEIVAREYGHAKVVSSPVLSPSRRPGTILQYLQSQKDEATVVLVGHEPDLSLLACWLLTGLQESFLELKKGAGCLIKFEGKALAGHGKLVWLTPVGLLRKV